MSTRGEKFQQLANLVSDLNTEQTTTLRKALQPSTPAESIDPQTLRSSPEAVTSALLAGLVARRIGAALDPGNDSLEPRIKEILNAPIRDGQRITPEMWNLMLARLTALEMTCTLLSQALLEALHPTKRPVREPFHTSKRI